MSRRVNSSSQGFSLIAALLLMVLISALAVALMYSVTTERQISSADQEQNLSRYAAEAGMEKMTADVGALYTGMMAPGLADISGLGVAANQPTIPGVTFSTYNVYADADCGTATTPACTGLANPLTQTKTITSGPNSGLYAETIPIHMDVVAVRTATGAEVHMKRDAQVALIPVFQFGVFSDSDLSFFPGPAFDFNGRVFTNGNLFLAAQNGPLSFHAKLATAGDVVRSVLVNDGSAAARTNKVLIPTAPKGCDGGKTPPAVPTTTSAGCQDLNIAWGSADNGTQDPYQAKDGNPSPGWTKNGQPTFGDQLMTVHEGVQPLSLPFVGSGKNLAPWEIIKRPPSAGADAASTAREYTMAEIRIFLNDLATDLPGGAAQAGDVNLGDPNDPFFKNGVTVDGVATGFQYPAWAQYWAPYPGSTTTTTYSDGPPCITMKKGVCTKWTQVPTTTTTPNPCPDANGCLGATDVNPGWFDRNATPKTLDSWPLVTGWLRVEYHPAGSAAGTFTNVTQEWLKEGFARGPVSPNTDPSYGGRSGPNPVHPNAILMFQMKPTATYLTKTAGDPKYGWFPINMYDPREGEFAHGTTETAGSCAVGGLMNVVELDMNNLRRWLLKQIGTSGPSVDTKTQNGYIIYFSDRRGMQTRLALGAGADLDGEYGYEPVVDATEKIWSPHGMETADGSETPAVDTSMGGVNGGEDINGTTFSQNGGGDGKIASHGRFHLGDGFGAPNLVWPGGYAGGSITDSPAARISNCSTVGQSNIVTGTRHALKLVNGSAGNLPTDAAGNPIGITIASEQPVYVQGNYNAATSLGAAPIDWTSYAHNSASVIADAVTLLSNNYTDLNSLLYPTSVPAQRTPTVDTYFRLAIASGKNRPFTKPGGWGSGSGDTGTDGGVHNFIRYLENWGNVTSHYRGSLVSMYYARYGNGIYGNNNVYGPPTRDYSFDDDFLTASKLPPGTPRLQDVNNLSAHQDFTPRTQ